MKFYIPYRVRARLACWLIGHQWRVEFRNTLTICYYPCTICGAVQEVVHNSADSGNRHFHETAAT